MKKMKCLATLVVAVMVTLSLSAATDAPDQPVGEGVSPPPVTTQATGASTPEAEAEADAVIRELLKSRAKAPVLPENNEAEPVADTETTAPEAIVQPLPMPPGSMIFKRLGRLVKDDGGDWWTFRFESDKNILYEPPMRILPNRQLEAMEAILEKSPATSIRFLISGEITRYRGQRYLLIRTKLVQRDLGAL